MASRKETKTATRKSAANTVDIVSSTRKAADQATRAAARTKDASEESLSAFSETAGVFNRRCADFAKANMDAGVKHAASLVSAKTPVEAFELQAQFLHGQFEALTAQTQELADLTGAIVRRAASPYAKLMDASGWAFPQLTNRD